MKPAEWERLLLTATEKVWKRVAPLAEQEGRGRTVGKGAAGDMTIYADKLAEDILLDSLSAVEGTRILSEEAGTAGAREGGALAVVDPLDGSSNFVRGIPFYCTSVAIVEGNSLESALVGVVRDLVTGDVYAATKGSGATKNGKPISASRNGDMKDAVVGVDLSRSPPGLTVRLAPLILAVKRQVHLGANALEVCYLAEGRLDSFVDLRERMRVTDFAAAYLIAKEAGAEVSGEDGEPLSVSLDLEHRFNFVASNRMIHRRILRYTARSDGGRD